MLIKLLRLKVYVVKSMSFKVQYVPFTIIGIVACTTAITFYLSYIKYEHVTYILPYISDTGTFPPESCIFGQGLNVASILIAFALYIKFLQIRAIYQKHHIEENCNLNLVTFIIGLLSTVGLNLVANFQETNAFVFHWFAAIVTFGGASIYLCLQSLLYIKISPVIGQRRTTMFRIVLSLAALISFLVCLVTAFMAYAEFIGDDITKWKVEDGGYNTHQISTVAEWISAGSTMVYISLFYEEFKTISVNSISLINLDEDDNRTSSATASL